MANSQNQALAEWGWVTSLYVRFDNGEGKEMWKGRLRLGVGEKIRVLQDWTPYVVGRPKFDD